MDGVLIVDKPIGKTSFDIVRDVRKKYNIKKVGHIGTLDPMATGVLPILIGNATKLSNYLMEHDKEYIATLKLGFQTDTGDSEGNITRKSSVNDNIWLNNKINAVLDYFIGESMQIPPMYSAIKVNGQKLYELAREGKSISREQRKIIVYKMELLNLNQLENEITFKVTCSKGTYIRTLCEDIATKLGTCGYMKSLQRTRVGDFRIEDADKFIDLENIFQDIPSINVDDTAMLTNGMNIELESQISSTFIKLYFNNQFIGLGKVNDGYYKRFILV